MDNEFDDYYHDDDDGPPPTEAEIAAAREKANVFYLRVANALSGCQLVEQQLKLYITAAFELVRKFLGDRMPFKMSGKDYEKSPMQALIKMFGKLSDNDQLVKELRAFQDERDFVSHNAIENCIDPMGDLSFSAIDDIEVGSLAFRPKLSGYRWPFTTRQTSSSGICISRRWNLPRQQRTRTRRRVGLGNTSERRLRSTRRGSCCETFPGVKLRTVSAHGCRQAPLLVSGKGWVSLHRPGNRRCHECPTDTPLRSATVSSVPLLGRSVLVNHSGETFFSWSR